MYCWHNTGAPYAIARPGSWWSSEALSRNSEQRLVGHHSRIDLPGPTPTRGLNGIPAKRLEPDTGKPSPELRDSPEGRRKVRGPLETALAGGKLLHGQQNHRRTRTARTPAEPRPTSGSTPPSDSPSPPGAAEPKTAPKQHSNPRPAQPQPTARKRPTDSLDGPSQSAEARWQTVRCRPFLTVEPMDAGSRCGTYDGGPTGHCLPPRKTTTHE
jgi:hypothetical protein